MYQCEISFKEYVNYTISVNCIGSKTIQIDATKIDEYHQKCIKEISEKYDINIELIKLIDSKIIIPINKLSHNIFIDYNTEIQIRFENAEIKNNKLIKICCCNDVYNIKKLNLKINQIIRFCNQLTNKYTVEQLTKKKSNGLLSSKVELIIYENYNELSDIKLEEYNYNKFPLDITNKFSLNIKDINNYILKQINEDALYCYNFVLYIYSLSNEEYNKIKENVQLKLKNKEEIFNKKIEPIIKEKVKEVSLNYDRIIKNLVYQNELRVSELNNIIEELKNNAEQASIELLTILEEKEKLEIENKQLTQKNTELEFHNKELDEKHNQMYEEDYQFFNTLITQTTHSKLDLNRTES